MVLTLNLMKIWRNFMTDKKISNIAIIGGCGHVGFPLGLVLAKSCTNYVGGGGKTAYR